MCNLKQGYIPITPHLKVKKNIPILIYDPGVSKFQTGIEVFQVFSELDSID